VILGRTAAPALEPAFSADTARVATTGGVAPIEKGRSVKAAPAEVDGRGLAPGTFADHSQRRLA
jgi:hypothetical protein